MASVISSREVLQANVKAVLRQYEQLLQSDDNFQSRAMVDEEAGRYAIVRFGRDHNGKRGEYCDIFVEILDHKVWIQIDHTECGIADDLVQVGIAPEQIVLGHRPREVRELLPFAVE